MKITLHPKQIEIVKNLDTLNYLKCGRRFGKSYTAMTYSMLRSITFPYRLPESERPVNAIICPTAVMATQIFWTPLLRKVENEWKSIVEDVNKGERRIVFKGENSIDLIIRGLGGDNEGNNLRGLSYWTAWIDEGQDINLSTLLEEVISPATELEGSQTAISFTPKGIGSELHTRWLEAEKGLSEAKLFSYTSWDNPIYSRKKLEEKKRLSPPRVYNQEVMAAWESFEGQVFSEYDSAKHLVDKLPDTLYYYIGVDLGGRNPAIALWGLDADLKAYLIYSWKNTDSRTIPPSEFFTNILRICQSVPRVETIAIPDDRAEYKEDLQKFIANNYISTPTRLDADLIGRKYKIDIGKIIVVDRGNPGPEKRAEWMNNLFYNDRLFISSIPANKPAINEINTYSRIKSRGVVTEKIHKVNNHIIDALAYSLCGLIKDVPDMRNFVEFS